MVGELQAAQYHSRERRRSHAGVPELHRTHLIRGASAIAVAVIDTGAAFPDRGGLVTFSSRIRVTANGGVHRGLVFEFGDSTRGAALWVGDQTIGFHAGAAGTADGATALYDLAAELPVDLDLRLDAAVRVGTGEVRLWGNGAELARATATNGDFGSPLEWSNAEPGSFATVPRGTAVSDVPVASAQAPDGFDVIAPLSVYVGQVPRHFV